MSRVGRPGDELLFGAVESNKQDLVDDFQLQGKLKSFGPEGAAQSATRVYGVILRLDSWYAGLLPTVIRADDGPQLGPDLQVKTALDGDDRETENRVLALSKPDLSLVCP